MRRDVERSCLAIVVLLMRVLPLASLIETREPGLALVTCADSALAMLSV